MKKTLLAVFTIFVMVVAACGGSDSASDNESSAEEAPSSSGTSEDSSSVGDDSGDDSDGNDARGTLIGLISAITGLENEDYVACIVDSVAESEGLTYEEILADVTSEESQTDEAAEAASIALSLIHI